MGHDSRAIANKFLELAWKEGRRPDPMQILKLVYIAHGWSLAINDRPLIKDRIEAWQYGPVIPVLFHAVKQFGGKGIDDYLEDLDTDAEYLDFRPVDEPVPDVEMEIIQAVWRAYGHLKAFQLSGMTHKQGTPWDLVYNRNSVEDAAGTAIPDHMIKAQFVEMASRNAA